MAIERRPLGRTGTDVTILGYGAMELRGQPRGPAITDEAAGQILGAVLDAGINLIDTSVDYGRSEELIGRYLDGLLDGMSRMEFVLRFTLSHPGLSSTIVGTANPEHLRANLAVAGRGPLPGDLYAEALRRLPAPAGR